MIRLRRVWRLTSPTVMRRAATPLMAIGCCNRLASMTAYGVPRSQALALQPGAPEASDIWSQFG